MSRLIAGAVIALLVQSRAAAAQRAALQPVQAGSDGRVHYYIAGGLKRAKYVRDVIVYFVALHEIGRAIGLPHSADPQDVMAAGGSTSLQNFKALRKQLLNRGSLARADWLSSANVRRRTLYPSRL